MTVPDHNGFICEECVHDQGLRSFVRSYGLIERCSFCEESSAKVPCGEVDETIQFTIQKILQHYEDPANSVGYESAERGYQLPTMDSWELLEEVGLGYANSRFLELLEAELDRDAGIWVRQNPYASSYHEQLTYDWRDFSKQVKHRSRFTFFKSDEKRLRDGDMAVEQLHDILDLIGDVVETTQTYKEIRPGDTIYRGRSHLPGTIFGTFRDLGSPPDEVAKQSRMSPAGISMFYGALDSTTVLHELQSKPGEVATVGLFTPVRKLALVDFSRPAWESSIFAYESDTEPEAAAFLNQFAFEIANPVVRDDRIHIEYVPTQVVTEYFRFLFSRTHTAVDGIAYRSSLRRGGVNVVLFADAKDCAKFVEMKSSERIENIPSKGE